MARERPRVTADHVCTITLDRPEKRNALTTAMIEEFHAAVGAAAARPTSG
jgi:enoyl-CoA hydratase/carnithine racemase